MQVALIAPIGLLDRIPNTKYHLVLAHLLPDRRYRDFFRTIPGHKILDNGEAEGLQIAPSELIDLASTIMAHEIVVPDTLESAHDTVAKAHLFSTIARQHPEFRYMGVVQGRDNDEREWCLTKLMGLGYMDVYALPRNMLNSGKFDRIAFAAGSYARAPRVTFHCLGSGYFCEESKVLANLPMVRGLDTAMPIKMGLQSTKMEVDSVYQVRAHDEHYFDGWDFLREEDTRMGVIRDNIERLFEWAKAPLSELHGMPA